MNSFILKYRNAFDRNDRRYITFKEYRGARFCYKIVTGRENATIFNDRVHIDNAIKEFSNSRVTIHTIYVPSIEDIVGELCTL